MKKLTDLLWNTTLYKIAVIVVMMLTPSYVLCAFPQPFSMLLLLWGAAFLVRDLLTERNFLRQTGCILLALFCVSYAITILLYGKNELFSTVHLYCWTIVEFLLLFAVDNRKTHTPGSLLRELYTINIPISIVALVSGAVSLACFIFRVSAVLPDLEGVNGIWFLGVMNGRNSGIFNNPISCSNAMFIGCAAALFNLVYPKRKHWYATAMYALTFAVCLMVTVTTLTRTYVYGIYLLLLVAAFIACFQRLLRNHLATILRILAGGVASVALVVLIIAGVEVAKTQLTKIAQIVPPMNMQFLVDMYEGSDNPDETTPSETGPDASSPTDPSAPEADKPIVQIGGHVNTTLVRDELDRLPNFFYPRNELWKVALQVVPHSPIFGFTAGNRQSSSLDYGTTPYFYAFEPVGIITYHNAYFDIAVSAGLLGLGLMLAFLGLQIVRTLRAAFSKKLRVLGTREVCSYGVLVGYLAVHVLITCMFLGVLCLTNVAVCVYFWVLLGYASKLHDLLLDNRSPANGAKLLEKFKK